MPAPLRCRCALDVARAPHSLLRIARRFAPLLMLCVLARPAVALQAPTSSAPLEIRMSTLALRVTDPAVVGAFYEELFGFEFERVATDPVEVWEGQAGGIRLKLVPIRERADFEGFPVHQPGFEVEDVDAILARVERLGGRIENPGVREAGVTVHAAIRDPDGNTIELYRRPGGG